MAHLYIEFPKGLPVACLILAHGAGAGCQSEFMQDISSALLKKNIVVVRFNFSYMDTMIESEKRRPPEKMSLLLDKYKSVIDSVSLNPELNKLPLFIGGKSLGGRVSTHLLDYCNNIKAAVVFGYPFHPSGKPEKLRIDHLADIGKPLMILQGERDLLGSKQEILSYELSTNIQFQFFQDGDHSLKPRKSSGYSYSEHIASASSSAYHFITKIL